jgi:hypothetical protein
MPALPPVAKVVQYTFGIKDHTTNRVDINRMHFSYTGTPPTSLQLSSHNTTVLTAFASAVTPSLGNNKTVVSLDTADLSSPTSGMASSLTAVDGALSGAPLPASTCLLLSGQIGRRYRGGHPRLYMPLGVAASITADNLWDPTFVATFITAWDGFVTAVEGAGWAGAGTLNACNVSYYQGWTNLTTVGGRNYNVPKVRVAGPVVDAIISFLARAAIAEIRKRLAV